MPWLAAGAVVSAGIGAVASSSAADKSAKSAEAATKLAMQQNFDTRSDLTPFKQVGHNASDILNNNLPGYGAPDNTDINTARGYLGDQADYTGAAAKQYRELATLGSGGADGQRALEATPGYQFALSQGLRATQNNIAARGLGISGAALKGAATFATGLADQTYGAQFNRLLTSAQGTQSLAKNYGDLGGGAINLNTAKQGNLTNSFNKLLSTSQLGENAASSTGTIGATLTNQAGQGLIAAGNAQAAGSLGVGNAISGNIQSGIQNYQTGQLINRLGPQPAATPVFSGSYGTLSPSLDPGMGGAGGFT